MKHRYIGRVALLCLNALSFSFFAQAAHGAMAVQVTCPEIFGPRQI